MLDEAVADFCVDSNDIILNQVLSRWIICHAVTHADLKIQNATVNGYYYCVFYLMCPDNYTIGQPVFLDPMINATINLINKVGVERKKIFRHISYSPSQLESELAGLDTDYDSDGQIIEEYELRIQQAEVPSLS
jgi:hypothetical protein